MLKIFKKLILIAITLSFIYLPIHTVTATDVVAPSKPGDICGSTDSSAKLQDSSFCAERSKALKSSPVSGKDSIFAKIISIIIKFAGFIAVIMIMVGGFKYVFSGGDQNAVKSAKETITYAIVGLVVAIFANIIVAFILSRLTS